MKTFIYLICTCFISTGAYFASLNSQHYIYGIAFAFLMWTWFLWGCDRRSKKAADRRAWYDDQRRKNNNK
jgi:hypothetical protein